MNFTVLAFPVDDCSPAPLAQLLQQGAALRLQRLELRIDRLQSVEDGRTAPSRIRLQRFRKP